MSPYLTTDPDIMRCPTCGHEWARDLDGPDSMPPHSCVVGLAKQISRLDDRRAVLVKKLRALAPVGIAQSSRTNHGAAITL